MTGLRSRRSALYMPASNAKAVAKARTLDCDVVILDLEDAVAPDMKDAARDAATAAAREGGFGHRELIIRANALSTPWGEADLAALRDVPVDAVLLPKVDDAATIVACRAIIGDARPVWAMVETARSLFRIEEIAGAEGLAGLVMGTNDIAKELGMKPGADRLPFVGFLANAVAAARAHHRVVLDGVYNAIDDLAGFAAECTQGVAFGFDGKTLIHPAQIEPCNEAFSPDAEEIAWANKVVTAFEAPEAHDQGAIRIEGKMVERLHLEQARRALAIANAVVRSAGA